MSNKSNILFLGAGYTAKTMMRLYPRKTMWGTTRETQKKDDIKAHGADPIIFDGLSPSKELGEVIKKAENILISIGPDENGDRILAHHKEDILANENLRWLGYLSTVGVYGNHDGAWVDETSATTPGSERSSWRKIAERQWLELFTNKAVPVMIFRLPGIYGKGRGPVSKLKSGTARRIHKEGQVFNRAHVEDIAAALNASVEQPNPGRIYNIADDEPAPPQDVLLYAAELLGIDAPPLIEFEDADFSPMARSFYSDNKRVSNQRMKEELGVQLKYPTYREGIKASI